MEEVPAEATWQDEPRAPGEAFVVDVDGYEGPLDVLLALARSERIDLMRVSILHLAEQYLVFIEAARRLRLELAADYLVMAAWLAYLKSRLLLPADPDDEGPPAAELAARLAFRLRKLEAMRDAAARLMARDRLGRDTFARGAPEGVRIVRRPVYRATLYELLKAYAGQAARNIRAPLALRPPAVFSLEQALERLERMLGHRLDWERLEAFLPPPSSSGDGDLDRSALASLFVASLELARRGRIDLRQSEAFGPIALRPRPSTQAGSRP
jgi:segregation and condensation protein A